MAITIATAPDTVSYTGLPMDFVVTSNRDSADANTVTLSDYSGSVAGTTKATTGSAHGYVTGDIVTITNTSNNGTYPITVIDADEFYFTATYSATDNSGNCTRLNSNFQVKAEVIIAAVTIATLRKFGTAGNYTFDVAKIPGFTDYGTTEGIGRCQADSRHGQLQSIHRQVHRRVRR